MHRTTLLLVVAVVIAAVSASPCKLFGQRISSPYEFVESKRDIGPVIAYVVTDRGAANLGPESGMLYGVQGTFRITNPLNIGGLVAYFPTQRRVIDPSVEEGGPVEVGKADLDLALIAGRLTLNLTGSRTWNKLMPYATIGLGIAIDLTSDPACVVATTDPRCQIEARERFDFGSSLLGQIGFGSAWLPTSRIGARFELLNSIWRLETPIGYFSENVALDPIPPETDWTNNLQLSLVLSYWF